MSSSDPVQRSATTPDPGGGSGENGESTFTVLVAAGANLGIAAAKLLAGLVSGSSAMLSEAAHSLADTVTELLLLLALRRSAKPADEDHPLGHGHERYIWALLASVATFVGGAVFSVYDGVHTLTHGETLGNPLLSYVVLAIAFVLEGYSLRTGLKQMAGEARAARTTFRKHLRWTSGGIALAHATGDGTWDGIASLLIGVLLVWVAWVLGRSNAELLTGRPLPPAERAAIRAELLATEHVEAVLDLVTLVQGPDEALVAAKIDFRDASTAAQVEWSCERAERRVRERFPRVTRVYLDPTPGAGQRRREGLNPWGDAGR
ncbi:cation diffusion facilitator family transporter [Streptomyces sp. NEAU-H3]|uniref:cation diffusion facilitator family transporter n=1 Tax=Streptomyces sp. NEAU-H3 TaxID=2720636 RepID=UPI00143CA496|nr:cation diffusion facilitator family transporter [Streptomyces sp. NEAU-H3]NJA59823.1 cation diffusion facilitator family transporter [Streptomyces sp. NEAU-H3]